MSDVTAMLMEMGFSKEKIEMAIAQTNSSSVELCMDWILSHPDDIKPPSNDNSSPTVTNTPSPSDTSSSSTVAKSMKCDVCNRVFATQTDIEFHAAKSGHDQFSESTDEKKPLTEEEKRDQLSKIEEKLKQRRMEREAREKQDEVERERTRIRSGKEILKAKERYQEIEQKKMIEQRKREKEADRLARQKVRDQIEQDKIARRVKQQQQQQQQQQSKNNSNESDVKSPSVISQEQTSPVIIKPAVSYTDVTLQIRLTDGSVLHQKFGSKEPLSAVKVYVELNRKDDTGPFSLKPPHQKEAYKTDDYEIPLEALGLAPRAILYVSKIQ